MASTFNVGTEKVWEGAVSLLRHLASGGSTVAVVEIADGLTLMLNVNNLFNAVGLTESEEAAIVDGQDNIIRARSINGRTTTATLKYTF